LIGQTCDIEKTVTNCQSLLTSETIQMSFEHVWNDR